MFELNGILMDINEPMYGNHMMNWWGIPFMGYYMLAIWALFIVVAILVYKDAKQRGMDGLLWFILVIIPGIGIFSLIIYLLVREEKTKKVPSVTQQTSTTLTTPKQEAKLICPYCGAENPPNAKFCTRCGSSIEP